MNTSNIVSLASVFAALLFVPACNNFTGVGDLHIYGETGSGGDDTSGSGDNSVGSGNPNPTSGGVGGTTAAGGTGPSTATVGSGTGPSTATVGSGAGETVGSGAGSTSGASTSAASTSSGGTNNCVYPQGGYGTAMGSTVDSSLTWQGYPMGSAQVSSVSIQDYYDCDGSKGVTALLILTSATWCGACQQEAGDLPANAASWAAMGIKVLTLMIEDANSNPATAATALAWRDNFNIGAVATVVADPAFSFSHPGSVGLPLGIIVDPRTMKIVSAEEGYSGDYTTLTQLAMKNK